MIAAPLEVSATLVWWMGGVSVASLVLLLLLLPPVVSRLPADYFVKKRGEQRRTGARSWLAFIGKNALGVLFLIAGVAMLVLPGQGVLTVLVGLLLVDFPGKRKLELKLVRRPRVLKFLNRMREKRGKPALQVS